MPSVVGDAYFLAIGVENRVELAVKRRRIGAKTTDSKELFYQAKDISGDDYFVSVRLNILELFKNLYSEQAKYGPPHHVFQRINRLVVSTVGVVENNEKLLQVPLWNWPTFSQISWYYKEQRREHFDFKVEILEAVYETAKFFEDEALQSFVARNAKLYSDRIHVVNDLAACAAAYFAFQSKSGNRAPLLYVKADNGVNLGAHGEGYGKSASNTEFGHLYVRRHPVDLATGFPGLCPFHGDCVEGMIGLHALLAREATDGFNREVKYTSEITRPPAYEPAGRSSAARYTPSGPSAEFVAHYLGHLIHAALLSPLPLNSVVLGGKLINDEVMVRLRSMVVSLTNEYPLRANLKPGEVHSLITASEYPTPERMEIDGALILAQRPPIVGL